MSVSVFLMVGLLATAILGVQFLLNTHTARAFNTPESGDVLLIHGINTSGGISCQSLWGDAKKYAMTSGWSLDHIKLIGFYKGDTNCEGSDISSYQGVNGMNLYDYHDLNTDSICADFATKHDTQDAPDGSGVSASDLGTDNENLYYTGCKLNWWIWENYTQHGKYVQIVAHSMGGIITRIALHYHSDSDMKNIWVEHVVTIGSPLAGVPNTFIDQTGALFVCPNRVGITVVPCTEVAQLNETSVLMQDLATETTPPSGDPNVLTSWTLISSECDGFQEPDDPGVDTASAMGVNSQNQIMFPTSDSTKRIVYSSVPGISNGCDATNNLLSYTHGQYMHDASNNGDAQVYDCTGCAGNPDRIVIPCTYANHALAFIFNPLSDGCSGTSGLYPPATATPTRTPPTATPVPPTATPTGGHYEGNRTTTTWAGWEAVNWHSYTFARATWTLPTISAINYSDMAMWVGFNGDSNEVGSSAGYFARVGVDASVDDVGDIYYAAFWEVQDTNGNILAEQSDFYPNSLAPGQKVSVTAWYDGTNLHFDFYDATTGWGNSGTPHTYSAPGWQEYTTDWMVSNDGGHHLANWSQSGLTMTNCTASPNNANWYPINANAYYSDSISSGINGSASAGSLTNGGTQFSPVYG